MGMKFDVPIALGRGMNGREHHMQRARRVRREREAVAWALFVGKPPKGRVRVTLTRLMAGKGLDGDNLQGSCKGPRDQVAQWLGRDDADPSIEWVYAQGVAPPKKGALRIEVESLPCE